MKKNSKKLKILSKHAYRIAINVFITIVLPLIVGIFSLEISSFSTMLLVIVATLGIIIIIISPIQHFTRLFSRSRLIFVIIPDILFFIQLFLLNETENVIITTENSYLTVDSRILFLLLVGIPILILVIDVFNISVSRQEWKRKIFVLFIIREMTILNINKSLRKYVQKVDYIDMEVKQEILRDFDDIIRCLNYESKLIFQRKSKFALTSKGYEFLDNFDVYKLFNFTSLEEDLIPDKLEVWTEEELEEFRIKENIN